MNKIKARSKLWLIRNRHDSSFGDGKWHLLIAIENTGSLKAASDLLGISYRKAWGDIKDAEKCLNFNLLERHRGGTSGGGSSLTKDGKHFLKAYQKFHNAVEKVVDKAYDEHLKDVVK